MYEAFYHLTEKPFSLLPDPTFLYPSEKHSTALSLFEYSLVGQAGFCVVTGEVGAGKTTLIRQFLQSAHPNTTVGVISNPHDGFGDLLDWVLQAFGLPVNGAGHISAYHQFTEFLEAEADEGLATVLIVDEAQKPDAGPARAIAAFVQRQRRQAFAPADDPGRTAPSFWKS